MKNHYIRLSCFLKIMNNGMLKIKRSMLETCKDSAKFEVIGIPDSVYGRNNDCCDYEMVMKMINVNYPDSITINPEGINGVIIVQLLHDTFESYSQVTREVERGGEFVEKYTSYDLILNLKQVIKR